MKRMITLAISLAMSAAFAQTTTTTTTTTTNPTAVATSNQSTSSIKSFRKQLKESPLSLNYYLTNETMKDEKHDINGLYQVHEAIVGYKINDDLSLSSYQGWYFTNTKEDEFDSTLTEGYLKLAIKNLLTEEDHGVSLRTDLNVAYYMNEENRAASNNKGYTQHRIYLSKNFGNLSTMIQTRYYLYYHGDYDEQAQPIADSSQLKNRRRLYTTLSYDFGKFSIDYLNLFQRAYTYTGTSTGYNYSELGVSTSAGDIGLYGYIGSQTHTHNDDKEGLSFAKDWDNALAYGLTVSVPVF